MWLFIAGFFFFFAYSVDFSPFLDKEKITELGGGLLDKVRREEAGRSQSR